MTPQEFKAWFDGFTEAVDKQPTQKQWARIKQRVAEIDGQPVTERIYVDRYWPGVVWNNHPPALNPYVGYGSNSILGAKTVTDSTTWGAASLNVSNSFDSMGAMNALGKAETASVR